MRGLQTGKEMKSINIENCENGGENLGSAAAGNAADSFDDLLHNVVLFFALSRVLDGAEVADYLRTFAYLATVKFSNICNYNLKVFEAKV